MTILPLKRQRFRRRFRGRVWLNGSLGRVFAIVRSVCQNWLVTGASGGIGRAIAKGPASSMARSSCSREHRSAALEALAGELGARVHVGLADLADPTAAERLAKEAEAAMGRVEFLVNNAGIRVTRWRCG